MTRNTIAGYLAGSLAAAGVERIWGVTGDSLNGLAYSLQQLGSIRWMHTRHEEAAAFAAGADAASTGRLAVCAGSCGPGNLHLINGLFDCHRNHQPVLAIAAHIPSTEIGLGYFQETHPQELFKECSHYRGTRLVGGAVSARAGARDAHRDRGTRRRGDRAAGRCGAERRTRRASVVDRMRAAHDPAGTGRSRSPRGPAERFGSGDDHVRQRRAGRA